MKNHTAEIYRFIVLILSVVVGRSETSPVNPNCSRCCPELRGKDYGYDSNRKKANCLLFRRSGKRDVRHVGNHGNIR